MDEHSSSEGVQGLTAPVGAEHSGPPAGGEPPLTPNAPTRRRLPNTTKDTIAQQLVMGAPYSEIAALHHLDLTYVHQMVRSDDMKDRVAARRQQLMDASSRVMFKFLLHADRLAEDQVNCALVPGPDQYKARTWILDRVAPARSVSQQQVDVNIHASHEVMVGLRDTLREVNQALGKPKSGLSDVRLLDGKTALPPVDYEMDEDS